MSASARNLGAITVYAMKRATEKREQVNIFVNREQQVYYATSTDSDTPTGATLLGAFVPDEQGITWVKADALRNDSNGLVDT